MQFFTMGSSKIEVSETYSFDVVITQHHHPTDVKHVLGSINVIFTLFGYWCRGGGVPRDWYITCFCTFSPWVAQNRKLPKHFFDSVTTQNDNPRYVWYVLGSVYMCFTLWG